MRELAREVFRYYVELRRERFQAVQRGEHVTVRRRPFRGSVEHELFEFFGGVRRGPRAYRGAAVPASERALGALGQVLRQQRAHAGQALYFVDKQVDGVERVRGQHYLLHARAELLPEHVELRVVLVEQLRKAERKHDAAQRRSAAARTEKLFKLRLPDAASVAEAA